MDKKTIERVKELDFNIHQLRNMAALLRGEKPDTKEPFYGNIGSFEQLPDPVKLAVAKVLLEYKNQMEESLNEM